MPRGGGRFWLVMVALALPTFARPAAAVIPGDVNGDTHVDGADVAMVLKAALGLVHLTEDQMTAADLAPAPGVGPKAGQPYGDGIIDIRDVIAVIQYRLNPPPVEQATFASIQKSVFTPSCAFSSCHSAQGHRAGLVLEEGKAYEQLVNVRCQVDQGKPTQRYRVEPGHPERSLLFIKLTHPAVSDGDLMPLGTESGLSPAKVELIRQWIARGAPKDGDLTPSKPADNRPIAIDPAFDDSGDVQLTPPPPGEGIQMEIQPFAIPTGGEVQRDYYFKFPSDHEVDIQRVEFAFNRGSHHLNIFKSDTFDLPDGSFAETFSAVDWERWYLVVDSQNGALGWQLPPGVAIHLKPHQQLNLQTHYVDITENQRTYNHRGKVLVNWWFAKPGTVKDHLGAMFAQNRKILLPPHAFSSFTKTVKFPQDVHILAMTGHFHSRGREFTVSAWDGRNTVGPEVYRSQAWGDPPFKIFESPVDVKAGQGLSYTCEYFNDTDKPMTFGARVEDEEHANLFVFFYPSLPNGKAIYDF